MQDGRVVEMLIDGVPNDVQVSIDGGAWTSNGLETAANNPVLRSDGYVYYHTGSQVRRALVEGGGMGPSWSGGVGRVPPFP